MIFFSDEAANTTTRNCYIPPFCHVSSRIKKEVTDKWFISTLEIIMFVFILNKINESIHSSLLRSLPNYTLRQRREVYAYSVSTKSKPDCSYN